MVRFCESIPITSSNLSAYGQQHESPVSAKVPTILRHNAFANPTPC